MERDVETRGESSTAHIHTHTQTYICIYYRDKRNKRGVRVSEEGVTAIWESNIFDLTAFLCRNIRNCGRVIDGQRQFRTGRSLRHAGSTLSRVSRRPHDERARNE